MELEMATSKISSQANEMSKLSDMHSRIERELVNVNEDREGLRVSLSSALKDADLLRATIEQRDGKIVELHVRIEKLDCEVEQKSSNIRDLENALKDEKMQYE